MDYKPPRLPKSLKLHECSRCKNYKKRETYDVYKYRWKTCTGIWIEVSHFCKDDEDFKTRFPHLIKFGFKRLDYTKSPN